jgi:hypothetical protein
LDIVHKAFVGIRTARGTHVHQERFRDDDISRLSSLEFLISQGLLQGELWEPFYRSELRRVRFAWNRRLETNEAAVKSLLDLYFAPMLVAIRDGDGKLREFRVAQTMTPVETMP